ncbi:MAG TPA: hypothetical protein VFK89_07020 [Actinomycetota bacterium]|nr:hypothetical protein [Actinomycetota bacterium]
MLTRKTLYVAGAGVIALAAIWNTMATGARVAPPAAEASPATSPPPAASPSVTTGIAPAPTTSPSTVPSPSGFTYAISLAEVTGLSPDVSPGTSIDVWVTWDPPITKRPKVQRLLEGAILDRIVPPVTEEGPPVAILRVSQRGVEQLIWGDRYGTLSAVARAANV